MKVTEITVSAGRTFNHPHEQYSNLKPQVTFRAVVEDGEDVATLTKDLQAKAEGLVEDHKNAMLKSINDLYDMTLRQQEMIGLQRQLQTTQRQLDAIRSTHPELAALPPVPESAKDDVAF